MGSNIDKLVDAVVDEARETMNNIVATVAVMTKYDWEIKVSQVMDGYYNDHVKGNRYRNKRTKSLRNDLMRASTRHVGNQYFVSIELDPSRMNHSPIPQFTEEAIFENFMDGAPGTVPYTMPGTGEKIERKIHYTTPSPQSVLDSYYENYDEKIDEFYRIAQKMFN